MSALAGLLDALGSSLGALHDTLARENEVLGKADPGALPEMTQRKEHLVSDLARTWSALATQLDVPVSRDSIDQALAARSEPGLPEIWRRILAMANDVDQLNRLNGRLIDEQLRRTQGAMEILQSAARQRALYGSDGRSVDLFNQNRTIDEA